MCSLAKLYCTLTLSCLLKLSFSQCYKHILNIYSQSILFSNDISQVVCSAAACQLVNSNLAHGLEVSAAGRKLLAVRRQLDALKMSLAGSVCNPAHCPKTLYICFGFECKTDEHQPLCILPLLQCFHSCHNEHSGTMGPWQSKGFDIVCNCLCANLVECCW